MQTRDAEYISQAPVVHLFALYLILTFPHRWSKGQLLGLRDVFGLRALSAIDGGAAEIDAATFARVTKCPERHFR